MKITTRIKDAVASSQTDAITSTAEDTVILSKRDQLSLFFNQRVISVLLLGFASGLPIALSVTTLQAWFTVQNVDLMMIGILSLAGMPYTWKFIWAPLMDRFVPPFLGRRRGWILITQVVLVIVLVLMSLLHPTQHPQLLGLLGFIVAFSSASQDIVINAYQTEILYPHERGAGAAMYVAGYRIAMLVSGGLALIIADHIGFQATYLIMAACMGFGIVVSFFGPESKSQPRIPESLVAAMVEPFKEFFSRQGALMMLVMIVLYKIGDAFALSLSSTFLLRGLHFSLTDVGVLNKFMMLLGTIIGVFIGGAWMPRLGLFRSLLIFGIFQAASNFLFMLLAIVGKHYYFAGFAIFFENFCGGLATAAFVALIMALCDKRFTAFQFALLTALSAVGRVFVGPISAVLVEHLGWTLFYFWTVIFSLPGLVMLWSLRRNAVFKMDAG